MTGTEDQRGAGPRFGRRRGPRLDAVQAVGWLRLLTGLALVVAPEMSTRTWTHAAAALPGGRLAARSLGGRELVLAAGMLTAPIEDRRPWLLVAAAADAIDVGATAASLRQLPLGAGALATIVLGSGACAVQLRAATR